MMGFETTADKVLGIALLSISALFIIATLLIIFRVMDHIFDGLIGIGERKRERQERQDLAVSLFIDRVQDIPRVREPYTQGPKNRPLRRFLDDPDS